MISPSLILISLNVWLFNNSLGPKWKAILLTSKPSFSQKAVFKVKIVSFGETSNSNSYYNILHTFTFIINIIYLL